MPISDVLKSFRNDSYGSSEKKQGDDHESSSSGVRSFKLTDDEVKDISAYKEGDGMEQKCLVTGKLEGNRFTVMSVENPGGMGGEEKDMAAEVMGKMPPMMNQQTQPSPS